MPPATGRGSSLRAHMFYQHRSAAGRVDRAGRSGTLALPDGVRFERRGVGPAPGHAPIPRVGRVARCDEPGGERRGDLAERIDPQLGRHHLVRVDIEHAAGERLEHFRYLRHDDTPMSCRPFDGTSSEERGAGGRVRRYGVRA